MVEIERYHSTWSAEDVKGIESRLENVAGGIDCEPELTLRLRKAKDTIEARKRSIAEGALAAQLKDTEVRLDGDAFKKVTVDDSLKLTWFSGPGDLSKAIAAIKLKVITSLGEEIALDAQADDSVLGLKKKIQAVEGVPIDQQRLVHKGIELREGSLVGHGIADGSLLHMVSQTRVQEDVTEQQRLRDE